MPPHTTHWTNLFQPTKTYMAKGLPMTQPLTQQQIADLKTNTLNGCETDHFKTDETILSLIATLEARDAAFEEMMAALKPFANEMETKAVLKTHKHWPDCQGFIGFDFTLGDLRKARSAIAHAEKVK